VKPFGHYHLLWRPAIIILVLGVLLLVAQRRHVSVDSGTRPVMGTLARIVAVAGSSADAYSGIKAAWEAIESVELLMSDYDPDSQLSQVNQRAFLEPVAVEESLFEVLSAAVDYSKLSNGAFDVTVGPVVYLYRQSRQTGQAPSPEALENARKAVGRQHLLLDPENRTVRFAVEGMRLDLGGIAKGYAIDQAIKALQDAHVRGGMVDIGGDIRCFGPAAHGAPHWKIGLQDPRIEDKITLTLNMDDRAVATSGDYRRFVVLNGDRVSHIIDPGTARSAQSLSSVSVIAPTAMQADALATAVSVLDAKEGLKLIDSIENTEAFLIYEGEFLQSPGMDQFILDLRR
jgi:thiamine biosynthesis lipoprotein